MPTYVVQVQTASSQSELHQGTASVWEDIATIDALPKTKRRTVIARALKEADIEGKDTTVRVLDENSAKTSTVSYVPAAAAAGDQLMGLDAKVYTGPLEPWTPTTVGDDAYDEAYEAGAFRASDYNGFGRTAPLEVGAFYKAQAIERFYSASYSGYGRFREWLCRTFVGVEPKAVWGDPDSFKDRPFFEQINFGDNDDTIGAEACRELAADYEAHAHAVPADDLPHSFEAQYAKWRAAFKLAAETGGAVDFG